MFSYFQAPWFYDAEANLLPRNVAGAITGDYSQLAPLIQLQGIAEARNAAGDTLYSGGEVWLTLVPVPAAVWLLGSVLYLLLPVLVRRGRQLQG